MIAVAGALGYGLMVGALDLPVALLAGLFVPLSLAVESTLRALRPGFDGRTAFETGAGVATAAAVTALVVVGAGMAGL